MTDSRNTRSVVQAIYRRFGPIAPATATASHEYGPQPVANLVDGDTGTGWNSGISMNAAVIQVDLDATSIVTLDRIRIHNPDTEAGGLCTSVKLYWSDNGTSYTVIGTYSSLVGGWNDLEFSELSHRYWRIEDNSAYAGWMVINEVQLPIGKARNTRTVVQVVAENMSGKARLNEPAGVTDNVSYVQTGPPRTTRVSVQVAQQGPPLTRTTRVSAQVAIRNLVRIITDDVGVTDSTPFAKTLTETATDPVGVTDDTPHIATFARTITDDVGVTDDTLSSEAGAVTATEAVGVTDLTSRETATDRTSTESVGVTDSTSRVATFIRTVTDDVGVTDLTSRETVTERTTTDDVGVTDNTNEIHNEAGAVTVNDPVGVTDATPRVVDYVRTATDPVGVADVVSAPKTAVVTATDPVGVTDQTTEVAGEGELATEAVGITDQVLSAKTITAIITDPVGVTDDTLEAAGEGELVTEAVGVTDQVLASEGKEIVEAVSVTDQTARIATFVRTVTDDVGVTDATIDNLVSTGETVTDPVGVTDSVTVSHGYGITVSIDVGLSVIATLEVSSGAGTPIYATGGATGGRGNGVNRNRRLPRSRLIRVQNTRSR